MQKILTTSGAVYLLDDERVQRLSGPYSPGINYDRAPDGVWEPLVLPAEVIVGVSMVLHLETFSRITTPVVSVEEVAA